MRSHSLLALPALLAAGSLVGCPTGPVPSVECEFAFPNTDRVSSTGGFNILLNIRGDYTAEELPRVDFFSDVEGKLFESAINTGVEGGCTGDNGCPAGGRLETPITPGTHVISAQVLTPTAAVACEPSVTVEANAPPTITSITITPADPKTGDTLSFTYEATDPEGDPIQVTANWTGPDDQTVAGETVAPLNTELGDEWTVRVTPRDDRDPGVASTATVTIGNTAPEAPSVAITPDPGRENAPISCMVTNLGNLDPDDSQTLSVVWSWTVDGADAGNSTNTVSPADQAAGEVWECSAAIDDGVDVGPAGTASTTVLDALTAPASVDADFLGAIEGANLQRLGDAAHIGSFRDADGDGQSDFALLDNSLVNAGNGNAHAWFFSGATVSSGSTLDTGDATTNIIGPDGIDFDTVWSPGDINGDGLSDIVIGWSDFLPGPTSTGLFIIFGDSEGFPATIDAETEAVVIYGGGDSIGAVVCPVGDLDGDGIAELAIAAPTANGLSGAVYVTYGHVGGWPSGLTPDDLLPGFRLEGASGTQQLGTSCAGPLDLDADGYDDLVAGAPGAGTAGNGRVLVYKGDGTRWSGAQTSATADAIIDATASSAGGFGIAMAALGDHDADGMDDFAIWGNGPDGGGITAGQVWIASGGDAGLAGALTSADLPYSIAGTGSLGFCKTLAGGDLDGDGLGDLACGDQTASAASTPAVHVFLGSDSVPATADWDEGDLEIEAAGDDDRIGAALSFVLDLNDDSYSELLIGAPDVGLVENASGTAVVAPGAVYILDLAD